MTIDKLFRVYSTNNKLNGNDNVRVTWYYADKKWVDVKYEEIIAYYAKLDSVSRKIAKDFVNEMFTEDEIEFLKHFIKKELGADLVVVEQPLPINMAHFDEYDKGFRLCGFGERAPDSNIIHLYRQKNYDLPFKVKGLSYQDVSSLSVDFIAEPKPDGRIPLDEEILVHSLIETIY